MFSQKVLKQLLLKMKCKCINLTFEKFASVLNIQEERSAKQVHKPGGSGSIKRKKNAEDYDPRPAPPKVPNDVQIRLLLGRLYGDRQFLDGVLEEAGKSIRILMLTYRYPIPIPVSLDL